METQKVGGELSRTQLNDGRAQELINARVAELITLLEDAELDYTDKRRIQHKLNTALKLNGSTDDNAENLHQFFSGHKTDTRAARKNNAARTAISVIRVITSLLMVGLGFGMIIMPAPPYFEMFTLFTIPGSNGNDGVTIMDVISLIIAFAGVSLLISAIVKFNR